MPVTIEGSFIVALKKSFRLLNEPELEKQYSWEERKLNERIIYLIKDQFGLDECDFPYFRYTDGIDDLTEEVLGEQEIYYKDLVKDYYIVYGSVTYMDSSHSWYQNPERDPFLYDCFYQTIFGGKTVIMDRKFLVEDTLVLLYAIID